MRHAIVVIAAVAATAGLAGAARADDPARRACLADAKRLCPEAVRAGSRHRAEVCLALKVAQTTPDCHAMIDKVRAERIAAEARKRP